MTLYILNIGRVSWSSYIWGDIEQFIIWEPWLAAWLRADEGHHVSRAGWRRSRREGRTGCGSPATQVTISLIASQITVIAVGLVLVGPDAGGFWVLIQTNEVFKWWRVVAMVSLWDIFEACLEGQSKSNGCCSKFLEHFLNFLTYLCRKAYLRHVNNEIRLITVAQFSIIRLTLLNQSWNSNTNEQL